MTDTEERWNKIRERVEEIRRDIVNIKDFETLSKLDPELSAYVSLSRIYRSLQDFDILQEEIKYSEKRLEETKKKAEKLFGEQHI